MYAIKKKKNVSNFILTLYFKFKAQLTKKQKKQQQLVSSSIQKIKLCSLKT